MKKSSRDKKKETINTGLAGLASDVIERHGSGVKEHIVAYSGVDYEDGTILKRSLKDVNSYERGDSQTNPNYANLTKSQAGFSAEIKEVSRRRADEVIKGKKPTTVRTDDIPGHVNDPLFDITSAIDNNGNPIPSASVQMKFVGSSPKAAVDKMLTKDYQKYIDNDVPLMVSRDYYDGMKLSLCEKISSLEKQIKKVNEEGKTDIAASKQAQLDNCKKLNKNLIKSKVTNAEAIEARNNPVLSTAKDIANVSHKAGIAQAQTGVAWGGSMSLIRNFIAVCKREKNSKEATLAVVGDTTSAGALSYATAFGGSAIKGGMQNAKSGLCRNISKTNLPAYIAVSTLEIGKTLKSFFSGDIDDVQCLEELGEKGYNLVGSSMFAVLGQAAIPIPVIGALAGSMIGYALSSASYNVLLDSLKSAKLSFENRKRIETQCAEAEKMIKEYRIEFENRINKSLKQKQKMFSQIFSEIAIALQAGDCESYITATNKITKACGGDVLFENLNECDDLMTSEGTIRI
ncbi:MAG: hypothetical protein PHS31_02135 [Victivallaceae bacterium]|nr:hypothetical protein [Victivallaceae bacterium]